MEKNIRNLRIGDVLKEYGYINEAQVEAALAYQKTHQNVRMGGALVELGYITEPVSYTHLDVYKRQLHGRKYQTSGWSSA